MRILTIEDKFKCFSKNEHIIDNLTVPYLSIHRLEHPNHASDTLSIWVVQFLSIMKYYIIYYTESFSKLRW